MINKITDTGKVMKIALIVLVFAAVMFGTNGLVKRLEKSDSRNPKEFNQLIADSNDDENVCVKVTITAEPFLIASASDDMTEDKYYILADRDKYMYLAKLSDKTYEMIKREAKKQGDEFSYQLIGYTYSIPRELKDIVIEQFAKAGTHTIARENFGDYFGYTYLDDSKTKYSTISEILFWGQWGGIVVAIIFFGVGIFSVIQKKQALKNVDIAELEAELEKSDIENFRREKIFLTEHYFISTANGLHVMKIKDIAWTYMSYDKINYNDMCHLTIHIRDGKVHQSHKIKKVMEPELQSIIIYLKEKNPQLMLGYNYENLEQYNKIKMNYQ